MERWEAQGHRVSWSGSGYYGRQGNSNLPQAWTVPIIALKTLRVSISKPFRQKVSIMLIFFILMRQEVVLGASVSVH